VEKAIMAKNIFKETQQERDIELAKFYELSVAKVQAMEILAKESLRIFTDIDITRQSYNDLYKNYQYMNPVHYIRTMSFVTINQRSSYVLTMERVLRSLKGKRVLDYGCGVGSHGIYCLQKGAIVDLLDVDGPLYNFAKHRINNRKLSVANYLYPTSKLTPKSYDAIICLDVLEHIADPLTAITSIVNSLKKNGVLCLEVSTNVQPTSGHFTQSINAWKAGVGVLNQFIRLERCIYRKQ
jgi:2-polyprenyl-3-methyl-5-hydroxy-6-metoxy-1,4-benzoquinol methylase